MKAQGRPCTGLPRRAPCHRAAERTFALRAVCASCYWQLALTDRLDRRAAGTLPRESEQWWHIGADLDDWTVRR